MRKLSLFLVAALLVVSALPALAQDGGDIVAVAAGDEQFSTLVAAVQAAGLVETLQGEGPFTVFAPTNDAFAAALDALGITAEELLGNTELLTDILLYHVVAGEALAADVVGLDSVTTVQGSDISITANDAGVFLNDDIQVIATDVMASNGVIHVIDGVLLPPSDEDMSADMPGTIVDVAAGDAQFSTLVAAVQAAGLVDALSGDGPLTVFAPTNDAFAAALDALGITAEDLLGNTELLTDILLYHVVDGEVLAADVVELDSSDTLLGLPVGISVADGNVFINDAQVIAPDVMASNGVIHVIDSVLLPPNYVRSEANLNFREGPGLDQAIMGSFPNGAIAELLGRDSSGDWLQIEYDGETGWVFAEFAAPSVAIDSLPVMEMAADMPGTIVDVAAGDAQFSTLVAAVQAAGLVDALNADGPYTVFAPTNDAFAAALDALGITAEDLLGNTELLTDILLYHVVEGEALAADVVGLDSVTTLQGGDISITVSDGSVFLNDDIQVIATDVMASNGVIHVIDGVLLPPSE